MYKTILSITALFLAFATSAPSVVAYAGVINDNRYGEHPYERRAREENRRKTLRKEYKASKGYRFDSSAYYHPIYAQRKQLHPFFRKGGVSNYIVGRYAQWRGYQDEDQAYQLSPDTYCLNFSYQRYPYRSGPYNYKCY